MSIASNLRNEFDRAGLSVATVAEQIQAEASSVRKYLSGKVRPSDAVLARLARCLGCDVGDLKYGRPRARYGKLTTDEVARATGIDPLSLRVGCQRGVWPFGTAYKRAGSTQYTYEYDPVALVAWIGARNAVRGGGRDEESESVPGRMDRIPDPAEPGRVASYGGGAGESGSETLRAETV